MVKIKQTKYGVIVTRSEITDNNTYIGLVKLIGETHIPGITKKDYFRYKKMGISEMEMHIVKRRENHGCKQ